MIKNKEYKDFLKKIISCISNGDYYSAKELSILTLNHLENDTNIMEKDLKKYIKVHICKQELKNLKSKKDIYLMDKYSEYFLTKINQDEGITQIASLEEFIQEII